MASEFGKNALPDLCTQCDFASILIIIVQIVQGGMGHLAIFFRMTELKKIFTTTVLQISKSITFAPKMYL